VRRRWVTLSNRRRVQIDKDGRIVKGIHLDARGVHVRDLPAFMSRERDLLASDCSRQGALVVETRSDGSTRFRDRSGRAVSPRFATKEVGVTSLLEANPELQEFAQANWGSDSQHYHEWVRSGRRGPKPRPLPGDGRFDPISERLNLRGSRRVASILEALYASVPESRRWEDFTPDLLWPLEECVGFRLDLPEETVLLATSREAVTSCRSARQDAREDLLARVRSGRLVADEEIPF
jgi:hypothetical protein